MMLWSIGLVRGLLTGALGVGVGLGLAMGLRGVLGLEPWNAEQASVLGAVCGVIAFLGGVGVFHDWAAWATGRRELAEPGHEGAPPQPWWVRYLSYATDHKVIGIQYIATAIALLLVGGVLALLMRLELATPGMQVLSLSTYNTFIGLHGMIMLGATLVGIAGLANYLIPLLIGARDMAFPRLNALSYWLVPPAALLLIAALFTGGFDTGWTAYPPLSARASLGMPFFFLGVYAVGLSSILGAVNFLVTILTCRAPGMTLFRMPIFVWAMLATSIISLTATQFIGMSFLMVLLERTLGMGFFDPARGGSVILFQHLFWFYSHPAVYIFVLPGLGIISEILPVFARKPLFGYSAVALSSMGIAAVSFVVWGHHMFVAGMENHLIVPFMLTSLLVAVPTGVKIFSWLATVWMGKLSFEAPALFALGAIVIFLIGGLTGVPNAIVPTDLHLHDTYWVVGHFHHTLFGGFIYPFIAAIYYWFPKATGRMYSEKLAKLQFWLMTIGFFLTTLAMLRIGLLGMRRRVADYDPSLGFTPLQLLATLGGMLVGIAFVLFLANIVLSALVGIKAASNPWRSRSLEWQAPSPPPAGNFPHPPIVIGHPYDYGVPGAVFAVL
jgi:cytochrome c oxidase subunit 1